MILKSLKMNLNQLGSRLIDSSHEIIHTVHEAGYPFILFIASGHFLSCRSFSLCIIKEITLFEFLGFFLIPKTKL